MAGTESYLDSAHIFINSNNLDSPIERKKSRDRLACVCSSIAKPLFVQVNATDPAAVLDLLRSKNRTQLWKRVKGDRSVA